MNFKFFKNFITTTMLLIGFLNVQSIAQSPVGLILGISGEVGGSKHSVTNNFAFASRGSLEVNNLFAYSVGIDAGIRLGKFTITTGGSYLKRGGLNTIEAKGKDVKEFLDFSFTKFPNDDVFVDIKSTTPMNIIRIPVILGYEFGSDNLKFRIAAGIGFNSAIGENVDFSRTYSFPDPDNPAQEFTVPATFDQFQPDPFLYGDNIGNRLRKNLTSIIINPCVIFKIVDNSYLKAGFLYETYGNIINDKWDPTSWGANFTNFGKTVMSSTMFTIGYEYRLDFGGTIF